jgi:hypothetical protein
MPHGGMSERGTFNLSMPNSALSSALGPLVRVAPIRRQRHM